MSNSVLLDAGPSLNFFGSGHQELLFRAAEAISSDLQMPEVVRTEVEGKSISDERFQQAQKRLGHAIDAGTVQILSDGQGADGLLARFASEAQLKLAKRSRGPGGPLALKDLGEAMVIAHARMLGSQGVTVRVMIDEWRAQEVAREYGLALLSTETVLLKAAKLGLVENPGSMKKIWEKLRTLDNGLIHWDQARRLHQRDRYGSEA